MNINTDIKKENKEFHKKYQNMRHQKCQENKKVGIRLTISFNKKNKACIIFAKYAIDTCINAVKN